MRYLVTGGAGFIGSHLCEELLRRDHSVICLDTLLTGQAKNIQHLFNFHRFSFEQINVCRSLHWQVDGIFHLASPTAPEDSRRYANETIEANTLGLLKMFEITKRVLFTSSVKVLGDCPRVEAYIVGKREGEKLCSKLGGKIARLASVYGPRMRLDDSRVIPVFIRKAIKGERLSIWNTGMQIDSFCFVNDIVMGLILFMESTEKGLMEFGSPEGISIIELAFRIVQLAKSQSPIYTGEKVLVVDECHKIPDISKAKNLLGWEPKMSMEEGLDWTIKYVAEKIKKDDLHPSYRQLGSGDYGPDIPAAQALCR